MPETFDKTPPEGGCYYTDRATGRVIRIPDWSHLPAPAPVSPSEPAAPEPAAPQEE